MDRRSLKETAKQSLRDARGPVKLVTLLCIIGVLVLVGAEWGLTELADRTATGGHYLSQALSAQTRAYVLVALISLVCQLGLVLLWMGYTAFSLRLSRGEEFSLDVLLEGFRVWGKTMLLYIYVSVLLALWSTLFSMPASYALAALYLAGAVSEDMVVLLLTAFVSLVMFLVSYRYRMAWFVLLDNPEQPVRQIVAEAKAINRTHRGQLFLLDLSFVPWYLLCCLTCGVLFIWKLPYITATYAHAYHHMMEDYGLRQQRLEEILAEQQERFRQM